MPPLVLVCNLCCVFYCEAPVSYVHVYQPIPMSKKHPSTNEIINKFTVAADIAHFIDINLSTYMILQRGLTLLVFNSAW